jgi:hypothetical protein
MVFVAMALATADAATSGASTDITSLVGLVNYGVLGVLTLGFIRGWVVSPKERDRRRTWKGSARSMRPRKQRSSGSTRSSKTTSRP